MLLQRNESDVDILEKTNGLLNRGRIAIDKIKAYHGCGNIIRNALSDSKNQILQESSFQGVSRNIEDILLFYNLSVEIGKHMSYSKQKKRFPLHSLLKRYHITHFLLKKLNLTLQIVQTALFMGIPTIFINIPIIQNISYISLSSPHSSLLCSIYFHPNNSISHSGNN